MFFTTLAHNIMIGPTIASGVILNPNILSKNIPITLLFFLKLGSSSQHCEIRNLNAGLHSASVPHFVVDSHYDIWANIYMEYAVFQW